jgi:hypothetical protein
MTASSDGTYGFDGGEGAAGAGWTTAEEDAGRKARRVVLGLGVALSVAAVAFGAVGGLAAPLLLGFAEAGGLSVSGAV